MSYKKSFTSWQGSKLFQLDSELIYSLKPNFHDYNTTDLYTGLLATNNLGFRDKEPLNRNSYDKRIVILGDSLVFGHGVHENETYPYYLQELFNKNNKKRFDVINAGIPGYGSDHEYKLFVTRLYKLNPDYLMVCFNDNDLWDNMNHPLYTLKSDLLLPMDAKKVWIYYVGNLYLSAPKILQKSRLFDFILHCYENTDMFHLLPSMDPYQLQEWSMKKVIKEYVELHNLGIRNKFKLIIIRMPDGDFLVTKKGPGMYRADLLESLDKSMKQDNIPYIDANAYFSTLSAPSSLFLNDQVHLTPQGYHILSEYIYQTTKNLLN